MRNIGRRVLNGYEAHPYRAFFVGVVTNFSLAILSIILLPLLGIQSDAPPSTDDAYVGVTLTVLVLILCFAFGGWLYGKIEPAKEKK